MVTKEPELLTAPPTTALARVDPQALIEKAIEANAGIETMERLVALAKEVREITAREAWYAAMAEFQRLCPAIKKTKTARMGKYSYRFAPLDEICSTIQPVMGPLGLSMRWTTPKIEGDKVTVACLISHTLGHVESSGDIVMPIMAALQRAEGGEAGANAAQRVGIALTYGKRYALLGILGMAPEDDDDAQQAGGATHEEERGEAAPGHDESPISEPQAKRLWAIAREQLWSQDEVKALLAKHGIEETRAIPRSKYDALINQIKSERKDPPRSQG
jgi:hypothetical protein